MTTSTRASGGNTQATRGQGMGQQQAGQSSMSSMLARGGSILAASLLFLLGVYHFFSGIAGFARSNFYTVGQNYPYQTSSAAWGWIHVIGGVLLVLTSLALFSRTTTWARPVAIVLAIASAVANFFFLAYFPLWAIVMIALASFCIWALVRDGQDQRMQERGMQSGMQPYATTRYGQPQTGLGSQQHAGAYGTGREQQQAGTGSYVSAGSSYGSGQQQSGQQSGQQQSGQRWPENAGGRDQSQQRGWSPSDVKESASRLGNKVQEQAQSGARSGQSGSNMGGQASEQAKQAARDYRAR